RSIFKGIGIGDPFARGSGAPQPSLTPEEKSNRDYYEQQLKSYQKKPTGPGAPAGFYSSEFGGGDFGGGVSKATDREGNFQRWITEQQMSRNIEDRRNEATRDDTAQTKDNTRELKRLNDFLYQQKAEKDEGEAAKSPLAKALGIENIPEAAKDG